MCPSAMNLRVTWIGFGGVVLLSWATKISEDDFTWMPFELPPRQRPPSMGLARSEQ
jgi:hypothetical protein